MALIEGQAYPNAVIASHADHAARTGRARRRQMRRQSRQSWVGGGVRLFAMIWLMVGMLLPAGMHRYTVTQAATINSKWQLHPAPLTGGTPVSEGPLTSSPTPMLPTPTSTASPSPTATPTATPLPAHLVQATAWQATLDLAADYSHATQTQAAGQYAATQTALPPVLTANALNRAATSTAAVR
jgi:hypothetical protein